MKQIALLSAQKRRNVNLQSRTIVRLCKVLSENPAINCIITSVDDFDVVVNKVTIKQGAILKEDEIIHLHFADPVVPDYVFFYCDSEDSNEASLCFKLLKEIAERGIPVSVDADSSKMGVKSILEERCKTFELTSGLQIPRPKTVIITGQADKPKIISFIKENGPSILKPHNSSRGRGIQTITSETGVDHLVISEDRYVLQNLIPDPMTIDGYKIGLRVYLMIDDLRKPVYNIAADALVKLAVKPYLRGDPEAEIVGSSYAKRNGHVPVMYLLSDLLNSDQRSTWTKIQNSIANTLRLFMEAVAWRASMNWSLPPSFQCWGIDIAIQVTDEGPKAYLIEANTFPAFYRDDVAADKATDVIFANELFAKAVNALPIGVYPTPTQEVAYS